MPYLKCDGTDRPVHPLFVYIFQVIQETGYTW